MRDDDAVDQLGESPVLGNVSKVWEPALVLVAHVHAAVKHNVAAIHGHQYAAPADICTRLGIGLYRPSHGERRPHASEN